MLKGYETNKSTTKPNEFENEEEIISRRHRRKCKKTIEYKSSIFEIDTKPSQRWNHVIDNVLLIDLVCLDCVSRWIVCYKDDKTESLPWP